MSKDRRNSNGMTRKRRGVDDRVYADGPVTGNKSGAVVPVYYGYQAAVIADGPIGYWPLNDLPNSQIALDISGNNNHGAVVGAVTLGQAGALRKQAGTSALFDGVSSWVEVGNKPFFNLTAALSMEFLAKFTSATTCATVGKSNNSVGAGYLAEFITGGKPRFWAYTTGSTLVFDFNAPNGINDGLWHHIAMTYTGDTTTAGARIFVDGVLVASATATLQTQGNTANPFRIGALGEAASLLPYTGNMSDVAVYSKSLEPGQVKNHYNLSVATN